MKNPCPSVRPSHKNDKKTVIQCIFASLRYENIKRVFPMAHHAMTASAIPTANAITARQVTASLSVEWQDLRYATAMSTAYHCAMPTAIPTAIPAASPMVMSTACPRQGSRQGPRQGPEGKSAATPATISAAMSAANAHGKPSAETRGQPHGKTLRQDPRQAPKNLFAARPTPPEPTPSLRVGSVLGRISAG